MNDTCRAEYKNLTHPVTIAYIEPVEETILKTLKLKLPLLVRVHVSKIECGSVKLTVDLYFAVATPPNKTESIMLNSIKNDEFPLFLNLMKRGAVKMEEINRCNLGNNPCAEYRKCVAAVNFTHSCECEAGHETEMGVCVKDHDLALKVALPVVLIILFIVLVVLLLIMKRSRRRSASGGGGGGGGNEKNYEMGTNKAYEQAE